MTGNSSRLLPKTVMFFYRALLAYLLLVFLFISNFLGVYNIPYLNAPFNTVTIFITRISCQVFLAKQFKPYPDFHDHYWTYAALLSWLIIALAIALLWSLWGKAKKDGVLFAWAHLLLRYYLAAVLLGYGISKLLADQFGHVDFSSLIQPLGNLDPDLLFWKLVGASHSYQIFSGAMETLAAILLLFRRTTTAGCLLAIALLVNVLMLDIAYNIFVKARVSYLIILAVVLAGSDLQKIIQLLAFGGTVTLCPPVEQVRSKRYHWILYGGKVLIIAAAAAVIIRKQTQVYHYYHQPLQLGIAGIYKIQSYQVNHQAAAGSLAWRQMAIDRYSAQATVQLTNDSLAPYVLKADTANHLLELIPPGKPRNKYTFHYQITSADRWEFRGKAGNDTITFSSQKVIENTIPLTRSYGRIVWDF